MEIGSSVGVYVISVAAELASMHPQTLRQYDRLGLVSPQRTAGRGRRYSADDVARLQLIQRLSKDEGINLAGIKRILELQREAEGLRARTRALTQELSRTGERSQRSGRIFAAGVAGDVVSIVHGTRPRLRIAGALLPGTTAVSGELVPYRRAGR